MAKKEERVKLLGFWISPFSRRVEMALKLKGVPYEYLEEELPKKSPLLLELNPVHKKVPVLVHNDKILSESHVILEYIDQTWSNNPILPQDPYERATARFWAKFVDEQILPAGFMPLVKPEKGIEVAIEETRELIMFLEKEVTGKDFFGGKTIGFLDMVAGTMIPFCLARAWECMGIDMISEDKFPGLDRWIKKLNEVEIVRECIPPKEKHIERMNKIIERIAIEETRELIMFLEKEVTGKDFFGGKTIGFLDMVAGTMIPFCLARAWECMGIDMISEDKFPGLDRWIKKLNEVEIVRECIPPKEKHIERMNKIIERKT
ncbi:hypothetical protein F2Q70_00028080 [Brassica cretica]|uniref:glutathione transferase n=1 Tax=Brassica cretica TaxID=69181 RepID=A0A8S9L9P3_BRACR|nr:hypothetical protein F2Q70_00028080 [Brassica cretica]